MCRSGKGRDEVTESPARGDRCSEVGLPSTATRGRAIRTPGRAASDDTRWVVVAEHLQELGSTVRLERPARLLRQTHWVGGPGRFAYLDHPPRTLVIAADLPQPAAAVTARVHVPTEVCPDLPMAALRIVHHASSPSAARPPRSTHPAASNSPAIAPAQRAIIR